MAVTVDKGNSVHLSQWNTSNVHVPINLTQLVQLADHWHPGINRDRPDSQAIAALRNTIPPMTPPEAFLLCTDTSIYISIWGGAGKGESLPHKQEGSESPMLAKWSWLAAANKHSWSVGVPSRMVKCTLHKQAFAYMNVYACTSLWHNILHW